MKIGEIWVRKDHKNTEVEIIDIDENIFFNDVDIEYKHLSEKWKNTVITEIRTHFIRRFEKKRD